MIQSPINDVIVTIDKTGQFVDKQGNIHVAVNYDPTEHVTILGQVHSLPRYVVQDRPDFKGYSTKDMQPGDQVIMRYDVLSMYKLNEKQPENDTPLYQHHFFYRGQSYWRASILACFAVIRDYEIIMLNGYVMIELPSPPPKIFIPNHLRALRKTTSALVMHIGNPLTNREHIGAVPGDTVYFNPRIMQVYQIAGKPFGIIKQSHVCGVEIKSDKKRIMDLCDAGGL